VNNLDFQKKPSLTLGFFVELNMSFLPLLSVKKGIILINNDKNFYQRKKKKPRKHVI